MQAIMEGVASPRATLVAISVCIPLPSETKQHGKASVSNDESINSSLDAVGVRLIPVEWKRKVGAGDPPLDWNDRCCLSHLMAWKFSIYFSSSRLFMYS